MTPEPSSRRGAYTAPAKRPHRIANLPLTGATACAPPGSCIDRSYPQARDLDVRESVGGSSGRARAGHRGRRAAGREPGQLPRRDRSEIEAAGRSAAKTTVVSTSLHPPRRNLHLTARDPQFSVFAGNRPTDAKADTPVFGKLQVTVPEAGRPAGAWRHGSRCCRFD